MKTDLYLTFEPGDFFIMGSGRSQQRIHLKEKINDILWFADVNGQVDQRIDVRDLKWARGKRMTYASLGEFLNSDREIY